MRPGYAQQNAREDMAESVMYYLYTKMSKQALQKQRPVRYAYSLTAKGRDLGKVLAAVAQWGDKHIRGTVIPPEFRKRR